MGLAGAGLAEGRCFLAFGFFAFGFVGVLFVEVVGFLFVEALFVAGGGRGGG